MHKSNSTHATALLFQHRKRYGLHAMALPQRMLTMTRRLSWFQYRKRYGLHAMKGGFPMIFSAEFQYRKRYGLHAIMCFLLFRIAQSCSFNTASGTDCMQYCLPKPLETVNPKGGFLILPPCLRFSPNRREFFCRKRRLKRGAKPAIPRKLLSTKKT